MSEEKGNYIVVSEYSHFCILENVFESEAVEIAEIMNKTKEDNYSRIFKIEKEINWKEQKEENSKENTEKGQNELCFRYDIFD